MGVLFAIGSTCFLVGPFPGFAELVGASADASVFFVGSIFFTLAAALQCLETWHAERRERWSSLIQFAGTLAFNATTFRALDVALDDASYDRVVWRPDAIGSICFLVSGWLAYVVVTGGLLRWPAKRTSEWRIAAVNLVGCVAFGIAAIAGYVVPSSGSVLDLAAANFMTAFGGLCFLVGALLSLPASAPGEGASVGSGD